MTPEQEQLVLDMLCRIPDAAERLLDHVGYSREDKDEVCPFCWMPYDCDTDGYRHFPMCLVTLAKRLQETRKTP